MHHLLVVAVAVAVALAMSAIQPAGAAIIKATATLDGGQEVPAVVTDASGTATFEVDDVTGAYTFKMDVVGIDPFEVFATAANGLHLHNAPAGANGPIVVNLASDRTSLSSPAFGQFSLTSAGNVADDVGELTLPLFIAALLNDELYINLHTEEFAAGELRGQLSAVPVPGAALLLGTGLVALGAARARRRAA